MEKQMIFNVKKFIKFINAAQWDKVSGFFHKEVEYTDPFCPTAVSSADRVLTVIQEQSTIFPGFEYILVRSFHEDNHIVLELTRKGKKIVWNEREFAVNYSLPVVVLLDIKDGKITSYRGFFDVGEILRTLENASLKKSN
ncbi:nuclear transport factor 2 family protein [candidate division KSB1 bacterium]